MPVAVTPGKAVNSLEPSMRFFIMKEHKMSDLEKVCELLADVEHSRDSPRRNVIDFAYA